MLVPPMEPSIYCWLQVINMPTMQELITFMTPYNTESNSTPQRVIRNGICGSTPAASYSITSSVSSFTSPIPLSFCICNGRIVNIGHNITPNFM